MSLSTQTDIAAASSSTQSQLHALMHTAGAAPLDHIGWIRVTGDDRVRWLNGMVTNSIQDLKPGEGNFNFILSAQGRIQGTVTAFAQPESILLQTDRAQIPTLLATLDRFIIMDDVELTDITETLTGLTLIGPQAAALIATLGLPTPTPTSLASTIWHESPLNVVAAHSPLVPRFELWADHATIAALLAEVSGTPIDPEALELLRILEGTPRYGMDIRDKELPQETAQTNALHFAKGCYLGQEIVERIRSRGAVHRTFAAFRLEGPLPAPGTPIEADGKSVGELTSTAAIPFASGTLQVGLGYIRREALERSAPLTAAAATAFPIPLPVREP
jgi:folate-binding protein YgfZ